MYLLGLVYASMYLRGSQKRLVSIGRKAGTKIDSRINIVRSWEVWWVTSDVARILGLVHSDPINKHPSREYKVVPVNGSKVGRNTQIENHILHRRVSK